MAPIFHLVTHIKVCLCCIVVQIMPCLLALNVLHNLIVFLTLTVFRRIVICYLSQCEFIMLRSWRWQMAYYSISFDQKHLIKRGPMIRYFFFFAFNISITKTMRMYLLLHTPREDAWKKLLFSQAPDVKMFLLIIRWSPIFSNINSTGNSITLLLIEIF